MRRSLAGPASQVLPEGYVGRRTTTFRCWEFRETAGRLTLWDLETSFGSLDILTILHLFGIHPLGHPEHFPVRISL